MQSLVGVDIGGTSVKLGLVQYGYDQFEVARQSSIPTQSVDSPDRFIGRIAEAVKQLAGDISIDGVGVGCPGLIDPWKGIVRKSPNLPNIPGFPLRDALAERMGLRVELQNDANAAVLGEWLFSPGSRGIRNMCLLTLGTGIGGGVVCDGHLLVGADNAATELGHLKVEYTDPAPCGCGTAGCLEAYMGSGGIARIADQKLATGGPSVLKRGKFTTRELAQAALAGDAVALDIFRTAGHYLGDCFLR
jgi:glucokinase